MSRKRITISFFALTVLCIVGLHAQDMNVLEKGGNNTKIALNTIRSLNFNAGNLNINLKDGTPLSVSLENVRSLKFFVITDVETPVLSLGEKVQLYPNPAKDLITISVFQEQQSNVDIRIISLDGRTVYNEKVPYIGNNPFSIDISNWQQGIYGVIVDNGKSVYTGKFIKIN